MRRNSPQDRATAQRLAKTLATHCYGMAADGSEVLIDDPEATSALERAFNHFLLNGPDPHVIKLSVGVAEGFLVSEILPDADWYLSVWIDERHQLRFHVRQADSAIGHGLDHEMQCRNAAYKAAQNTAVQP